MFNLFQKASVLAAALLLNASLVSAADSASDEQLIRSKLSAAAPNIKIASIKPGPVPGLHAVTLDSGEVIFSYDQGDKFIAGDVYLVQANRLVNKTETERKMAMSAEVRKDLAAIPTADKITFSPQGETKATITVLTDVNCGYCRKMHREMDQYHAKGIEIQYLALPIFGGDKSRTQMVSAWCADNPKEALTRLKTGKSIESKTCDNPVARHLQFAPKYQISGTPAIILESGEILKGYVPADRLAKMLNI